MRFDMQQINISILFGDTLPNLKGDANLNKTLLQSLISANINTITNIVFTTAKPDGISGEETLVSDEENGAYGAVDGNTLYIYPNGDDGILYAPTDCSSLFYNYNKLTNIDFTNFNTEKTTTMNKMFQSCSKLTSLDLSNFDMSNIVNSTNMFYGCSVLSKIVLPNIDNLTTSISMFEGCKGLTDLNMEKIDLNKIKSAASMYKDCAKLTEVRLHSSSVLVMTNMNSIFKNCTSLKSVTYADNDIDTVKTTTVINMGSMFEGCTALVLSPFLYNIDVAKCTNISRMFSGCKALTQIGITSSYEKIGYINTMQYAFYNCTNITSIHFKVRLNAITTDNGISGAFTGCSNLTAIEVMNSDDVTLLNSKATTSGMSSSVNVYTSV